MVEEELPSELDRLRNAAREVARGALAPLAEAVDQEAIWPEHSFRALADARLMGLHVPKRLGGHGQGLLALAIITEELGAACSSSAMCYGMHCVAEKVIQIKATPDQEDRYLQPIAEGHHVSSLALSEPGTGSHFYLPETTFKANDDDFLLNGTKSFVTSGGYANSYVASGVAPGLDQDPGTFSCFIVDESSSGLEWQAPWDGFGMRGNSSRSLAFRDAAIPKGNLLGREGDELWYVFDVIAPFFLIAMSGVYVGIARAALELAIVQLGTRRHSHSGAALGTVPALSDEIAELWIAVARARQLIHHAARLGDAGSKEAGAALFACKIEVGEAAISVTNRAMTLGGGRAYEANGQLARLLRDGRAAEVMSPTGHMLKGWLGRTLLGAPLF